MTSYPDNFNFEDIIDTSYYEKRQVKIKVKKYKIIKVEELEVENE